MDKVWLCAHIRNRATLGGNTADCLIDHYYPTGYAQAQQTYLVDLPPEEFHLPAGFAILVTPQYSSTAQATATGLGIPAVRLWKESCE